MALKFAIDWPGIRAAAVVLGIREAARRAAEPLPESERNRFVERVMKRSTREGWQAAKSAAMSSITVRNEKPLSANVHNGAKAALTALADDNQKTRLGLSRGVRRAAEVIGDMDGDGVIAKSEDVRRVVSSAAQIHGWDQGKSAGVQFKLLQIGGTLTLVSEGQGGGNDDSI